MAHGAAVLATLGYTPVRRRSGSPAALVGMALLAGVLGAFWLGWRILHPTSDQVASPARGARSATIPTRPASGASNPASPSPVSPSSQPPLNTGAPAVPSIAPPASIAGSPAQPSAAVPRPSPTWVTGPLAPLPPAPSHAAASIAPPGSRPVTAPPASSSAPNDLELALYYHRAGDFENALQHYRALLQKNELDAQAHNNMGLLYQEKNLLQESARELQRAILIEPRNAGAHNNYGVTLLMQGKSDEAAAQFRSVLALNPRDLDALVNLALAQRTAGQLDVAKETLLDALTIAPRNAAAHYNLAQLYDQTNESARAVEHYRVFLETAGVEHAARAAAVRVRIAALSRTPE